MKPRPSVRHTPCVSRTLPSPSAAHPRPALIVSPFYQIQFLKHLFQKITSPAVSKSDWITNFSSPRTMLIFDLLIQYCVLLNSQQITDFGFTLLCSLILISDCKFFLQNGNKPPLFPFLNNVAPD